MILHFKKHPGDVDASSQRTALRITRTQNAQSLCALGFSSNPWFFSSLFSRCVLGNTTILAEFATDDEVSRFLAQAQPPTPAATPSAPAAGWQSLETSQTQSDPVGPALNLFGGSTGLGQWSSSAGGSSGADLAGASLWGPPNYSSSLWGVPTVEDPHRMGSPAPLLPGDLLGGGSDSI